MAHACFASAGGEGNWRISGGSCRHRVRVGCTRRREPRESGPGWRCGPGSENSASRQGEPQRPEQPMGTPGATVRDAIVLPAADELPADGFGRGWRGRSGGRQRTARLALGPTSGTAKIQGRKERKPRRHLRSPTGAAAPDPPPRLRFCPWDLHSPLAWKRCPLAPSPRRISARGWTTRKSRPPWPTWAAIRRRRPWCSLVPAPEGRPAPAPISTCC